MINIKTLTTNGGWSQFYLKKYIRPYLGSNLSSHDCNVITLPLSYSHLAVL